MCNLQAITDLHKARKNVIDKLKLRLDNRIIVETRIDHAGMNVDEADQRAQLVPLDHSVVEVQVEQQLEQFAARVDLVRAEDLLELTAGIVQLVEIGSNESVRAGIGEHNFGLRLVVLSR